MGIKTSTPGRAQPGSFVPGDLGTGGVDITVIIGATQNNGKLAGATQNNGKLVGPTVVDRSR